MEYTLATQRAIISPVVQYQTSSAQEAGKWSFARIRCSGRRLCFYFAVPQPMYISRRDGSILSAKVQKAGPGAIYDGRLAPVPCDNHQGWQDLASEFSLI